MDVSTNVTKAQAFLVRYRSSAARDEPRNVAVALISEDGEYATVRHLPPSQVAEKLRERGLLDSALVGLARLVAHNPVAALDRLPELRERLFGSILVEGPMPTDTDGDPAAALSSLYRSLIGTHAGRGPGTTRAMLLDRTVSAFRNTGANIRIGQYFHDYLVDALITPREQPEIMVHTQSFDLIRKDWSRAEYETAHFLWAAAKTKVEAMCILQAPATDEERATASHARINRWLSDAGVPVFSPAGLPDLAARFRGAEQLPLVMAI